MGLISFALGRGLGIKGSPRSQTAGPNNTIDPQVRVEEKIAGSMLALQETMGAHYDGEVVGGACHLYSSSGHARAYAHAMGGASGVFESSWGWDPSWIQIQALKRLGWSVETRRTGEEAGDGLARMRHEYVLHLSPRG
jgi:hypothetical protein